MESKLRSFHDIEKKTWDNSRKKKYPRMLLRRNMTEEMPTELTQKSSKNYFHAVMEADATQGQAEEWVGEEESEDSKYRPFHQEVWLSHPLRMKGIQTEKPPWGEEKFRRAAESYYRETWPGTSKKYNEPGRQASINGTSLPGWAILSCCHSLNLVEKHQIVVKKGKEKRKQQQQETMRLRGLRERRSDCPWDPGSIWKELWFQGGWKWMSQGIRDLNKDKRHV